MNSIVYKSQSYCIDATTIDLEKYKHIDLLFSPFEVLFLTAFDDNGYYDDDRLVKRYMSFDQNLEFGEFHFSVFHELNHYYQDLTFASCLCEKLLKSNFEKFAINELENGNIKFPVFDIINKNSFSLSDDDSVTICPSKPAGWYSSQDIKQIQVYQRLYNIIFKTPYLSDFHFSLTYEDMIESYAEIKATYDIYYNVKDEEIMPYLHSLFKKLDVFPSYDKKEDGKYYLNYDKIRNKYSRKYHIVRYIPLMLLETAGKSLFGLKFRATELSEYYNNGILTCQNTEINNIRDYAAWIDFFLLLAIEISMAIPAPSYYIENFLAKSDYEPDISKYIPPLRFFEVLDVYEKYEYYFWEDLPNKSFIDVYNFIASKCEWCSYDEIIKSYETEYTSAAPPLLDYFDNFQYRLLLGKGRSKVLFIAESALSILKNNKIPIFVILNRAKVSWDSFLSGVSDEPVVRPAYIISSYIVTKENNMEHGFYDEVVSKEYIENIIESAICKRLNAIITTRNGKISPFRSVGEIDNIFYSFVEQLCRKGLSKFILTKNNNRERTCPLYYLCLANNETCKRIKDANHIRWCMTLNNSLIKMMVFGFYRFQSLTIN